MNSNFPNNVEGLRSLYQTNSAAKATLDYFASRQRNATETKVETLEAALAGRGSQWGYYDLLKVVKRLCDLGYGKYIEGRKGHKSRVSWTVSILSLGQAAAGARSDIEALSDGAAEEDQEAAAPSISPSQ